MKAKNVTIKMTVKVPAEKAEELKVLTHHIEYLIDEISQKEWSLLSIGDVKVDIKDGEYDVCDECGAIIDEDNHAKKCEGEIYCRSCLNIFGIDYLQ